MHEKGEGPTGETTGIPSTSEGSRKVSRKGKTRSRRDWWVDFVVGVRGSEGWRDERKRSIGDSIGLYM